MLRVGLRDSIGLGWPVPTRARSAAGLLVPVGSAILNPVETRNLIYLETTDHADLACHRFTRWQMCAFAAG